jgi:hypothetical protein
LADAIMLTACSRGAAQARSPLSLLKIMLPQTIRPLIAFILLIATLPPVAATSGAASDLYISATLTKIERSKDSNSRKTTVTVSGNKIVYERTYGGAGRHRRKPVHKEYKITGEEIKRLERIVVDHNLLTSGSLEYPATGGGFLYFEISLDVRFEGKQAQIEMSGPSKAAGIRDHTLFKNSNALVEEIFRIIKAQDKEVRDEDDLITRTQQ